MPQPLTDAINALTTYANTVTGKSPPDTTLSDAVATLASGYGQGGGWSTDGIASKTEPSGAITISNAVETIASRAFSECQNITEVTIEGNPYFGTYAFQNCRNMETLNTPNVTTLKSGYYSTTQFVFDGCSKLKGVVFPNFGNNKVDSYIFRNCTNLTYADFKNMSALGGADVFDRTSLNVLILRKTDGVTSLAGINVFGSTPFASNGTGGTLYVPANLKTQYEQANNWSTILGYANNSIQAIEGSYYETHYADGTPIE